VTFRQGQACYSSPSAIREESGVRAVTQRHQIFGRLGIFKPRRTREHPRRLLLDCSLAHVEPRFQVLPRDPPGWRDAVFRQGRGSVLENSQHSILFVSS
jgi:hypothetical protein